MRKTQKRKQTQKRGNKKTQNRAVKQRRRTNKHKTRTTRKNRRRRKYNKRGGAAAEEEEEYYGNYSGDENEENQEPPHSAPQTMTEFENALTVFKEKFNPQDGALVELMMKENNKVMNITSPDGLTRQIDVLKRIKQSLRRDNAKLDVLFQRYLCAKLEITIAQLKANPQGIISTAHASSTATQAQAVIIARQEEKERYIDDLNNILKIIKGEEEVSAELLVELKTSLGYNNMELNNPEVIYAWAQFVAGCAMIASNTNSGSIMGVLTILFSNKENTILEKPYGPDPKPLKVILIRLLKSKQIELLSSMSYKMKTMYTNILELLNQDPKIGNMKKMADKMIKVVGNFLKFITRLELDEVEDLTQTFSLTNHHFGSNRVTPTKAGNPYNSDPGNEGRKQRRSSLTAPGSLTAPVAPSPAADKYLGKRHSRNGNNGSGNNGSGNNGSGNNGSGGEAGGGGGKRPATAATAVTAVPPLTGPRGVFSSSR